MNTQSPSRNRVSAWRTRTLNLAAALAAFLAVPSAPAATIAWVGYHPADDSPSSAAAGFGFTNAPDAGYTVLLASNGYTVTRVVSLDNASASQISYLNTSFDLIILSRSGNSDHFGSAAEATAWNGITVPMIVMNGYHSRQSRLGYFTGSTIPDVSSNPVRLNIKDRSHPVFAGIALDSSTNTVNPYASLAIFNNGLSNTVQRGISVVTSPIAAGGRLLASVGTTGDAALR